MRHIILRFCTFPVVMSVLLFGGRFVDQCVLLAFDISFIKCLLSQHRNIVRKLRVKSVIYPVLKVSTRTNVVRSNA